MNKNNFQMISSVEEKAYPVGIVGEASYQPSIRRCRAGQHVQIVHEPDNPYDPNALAVVTSGGNTIGYIARDCWVQDAIHREGHGCSATIKEIMCGGPHLGVVLEVTIRGVGVASRSFGSLERKGWFARLFGI